MGHLYLLSGASGVGKTTFLSELRDRYGEEQLRIIPRHTERPRRPNEEDDFEYHFLSHRDFLSKVYANDFVYVERWGNFYTGIDASYVAEALAADHASILLASVYGAARLLSTYGNDLSHLYMWTGSRKSLLDPSCLDATCREVQELIDRIRKKNAARGFSPEEIESLVSDRFAEKRMVDNFVDIAAANARLRQGSGITVISNYRDRMGETVERFSLIFDQQCRAPTHIEAHPRCFVLMPFADKMTPVYDDHIVPVCDAMGVNPSRADRIFSNRPIMDDIRESVSSADVIIADLTNDNPNVFYEVGICHALGKRVILTSQNSNIPFDLRHVRCIIYEYTPPGMREFEARLSATLRSVLGVGV